MAPDTLARSLKAKVFGQDPVIDLLVSRLDDTITPRRPDKPAAVFCFVGATGVGKTYLARVLADTLFGDPKHLLNIDMVRFNRPESAMTLFGARDLDFGKRQRGLIESFISEVPNGIVLLDEEAGKAHPSILRMLASMWSTGFVVDPYDASKRSVSDAIFIMTTGVGSARIREAARDPAVTQDELNRIAESALQDASFPPEVIAGLDQVLAFREPAGHDLARIVAEEIQRAARSYGLEMQGIDPEFFLDAIDELSRNEPRAGVRAVPRHVEEMIADGLIEARTQGATRVRLEVDHSAIRVIPVDPQSSAMR